MMFAVKKLKCLGCKTPIPETEKSTLCLHCRPREAEIYTQKALEVAAHEGVFSKLWTQCQRCQGSFHQVGREGGGEGGREKGGCQLQGFWSRETLSEEERAKQLS